MQLHVLETPAQLGQKAAEQTAAVLNEAIAAKGSARIILSTGASQFDTIEALRKQKVDWTKVEMFHLDEYIGIGNDHPASFIKYLKERFLKDDIPMKHSYFIDGLRDPDEMMAEVTKDLLAAPVDVALIGIGENAHIAFNDPPANFDTKESFIIVELDEACKAQQVREKWFATLDDVPKIAITMTVHQIMQAKVIISCVPYPQKAQAVANTVNNDVTNMIPATILKTHPNWSLYVDKDSAALLK